MATSSQTNTTLEEIAQLIGANESFALCGHVSPDGDCLGSQLALAAALKALGKQVSCLLVRDEAPDPALSFMPGFDELLPACRFEGVVDVFMGLDVPSRKRIGEDACRVLDAAKTSVTIDHHAADETMCDHVFVDPDAASASLLVWELVKLLCEKPPLDSAICVFTGLVTDTGRFSFQNADERAFRVASELVATGINPSDISAALYQSRSLAALKLESLLIERMELIADGQAAISWISQADMDELGAEKRDTEELVDALRSLAGVRVACFLREQDGSVRGSLRAKDDTDVASLAREFDGGGHKAAAGFTFEGELSDARRILAAKLVSLCA